MLAQLTIYRWDYDSFLSGTLPWALEKFCHDHWPGHASMALQLWLKASDWRQKLRCKGWWNNGRQPKRCFLGAMVKVFSRTRSEGSRFTLGVWGRGCARHKSHLCPQPFATVGNRLRDRRKALRAHWRVLPEDISKVSQVDLWHRSYIDVCKGGVCVGDLWRRSYFGICTRGVCESASHKSLK